MLLHPDKCISGTKGWAWPHILARRHSAHRDPGPLPPCPVLAMMRADLGSTHTNEPTTVQICPGHRLDFCFMEAAVTRLQSPQSQAHQRPWREGYPGRMQRKGSRVSGGLPPSSLWQAQLGQEGISTGPCHSPSWKELEDSTCLCGHANSGRVTPLRDLTLRPGVPGSSQ